MAFFKKAKKFKFEDPRRNKAGYEAIPTEASPTAKKYRTNNGGWGDMYPNVWTVHLAAWVLTAGSAMTFFAVWIVYLAQDIYTSTICTDTYLMLNNGWQMRCGTGGATYRPDVLLWIFFLVDSIYYGFTLWDAEYINTSWAALRNPARWFGYAVSTTLMLVLLYSMAPIQHSTELLMLIGLNLSMICFGLASDWLNHATLKNQTDYLNRLVLTFTSIPYAAIFLVLFWRLGLVDNLRVYVASASAVTGMLFGLFPLVMLYQQSGWTSEEAAKQRYARGEAMFAIISLTSKIVLAAVIASGVYGQ